MMSQASSEHVVEQAQDPEQSTFPQLSVPSQARLQRPGSQSIVEQEPGPEQLTSQTAAPHRISSQVFEPVQSIVQASPPQAI
jgi:hypothetical protein